MVEQAHTKTSNGLLEVSSGLDVSFPQCIENCYNEDDFLKPILTNPEEFTNFAVRDGLVFFKSEGIKTITILDI